MIDIIYPVFSLVMLTFFVALATGISRMISVRRREVNHKYFILMTGDTPPDYVQKIGRNFANLLETPILFYLLATIVIALKIESTLILNLAWLYVAFRLLHTLIHISYNYVIHRFMVFASSMLTLLAMWIEFILLAG